MIKNVRLVKFTFQLGKEPQWLEWCNELKRRSNEVLETLRNESVRNEGCFISPDGKSVYYFIEADDMDKANDAFRKSNFPIDQDHRDNVLETLVKAEEMEPLFYFSNKE